MHLLELVYVPAIRLFQSFKAMNANTVTASNGPTMKYHRIVALAENEKQNKTKTKRHLITMGQLKTKGASNTRLFSVEIIYHLRLPCERKTTTHFKVKTYTITHAKCCTLLCCTTGPSLSIHFLLIILIAEQSLFTVRIMTVSILTTELIPRTQAM